MNMKPPSLNDKTIARHKRIYGLLPECNSMPSHEEILDFIQSTVSGNICDQMHGRESLEDIIQDLLDYQFRIASIDEYHKANKL